VHNRTAPNNASSAPHPSPPSITLRLATLLVMACALFGPLAFGATQVWAWAALECGAGGIILLCLVRGRVSARLSLLPVAVLVIGILQVVPLPASILKLISPLSWSLQNGLDNSSAADALNCVSLNCGATLSALRRLFLMAMTVLSVAALARHSRYKRAIAWTLALTGIAVLLLGILFSGSKPYRVMGFHDMTGPIRPWKNPLLSPLHSAGMGYPDLVRIGGLHYVADAPVVGDVFGPFVSSNQFAACIGLTLPVLIGLLLGFHPSRPARIALYALAAVAACAALATVAFGAHSRAGVLALLSAFLAMAFLGTHRKSIRAALAVLAAAGLVTCALLFAAASRPTRDPDDQPAANPSLAALELSVRSSARRRLAAWRAGGRMLARAPILGVGLGAYEASQPAFGSVPPVFYFAHNDYLQLAAETGIIGLIVATGLAVFLFIQARKAGRHVSAPRERILRLGIIGALCAFAVHSVFDYNLHVPANAFLFAVLLGLLLAPERPGAAPAPRTNNRRQRRGLHPLLTGPAILLTLFAVAAATLAALADRSMMPLRHALVAARVAGTLDDNSEQAKGMSAALPAAERAFALSPLNADYAETIGQAHLLLSRGINTTELRKAATWFTRSARLSPVSPWTRHTLSDILSRLSRNSKTPPASDPS